MKRLLLIISFVCIAFGVFAQKEDPDELLAEMGQLIQSEDYGKAKSFFENHKNQLSDNGVYEIFSSYLYGCLLYKEKDLNGALEYMANATRILDVNYNDAVEQKNAGLMQPYYHLAYLSWEAKRPDVLDLYRKAKKAYEDACLTTLPLYTTICEEMASLESAKDIDRINNIVQGLTKEVAERKFKTALPKIDKCISSICRMPTPPKRLLTILYQLKGRIMWELGNMNEAESSYLAALHNIPMTADDVPQFDEDKDVTLRLWIDLAAVYGAVNDYQSSASMLQLVKTKFEEDGNLGYEYARCLGNLAVASMGLQHRLEASIYLETSLDILTGLESVRAEEIATAYGSLIQCYNEMGNNTEALDAFERATQYLQQCNNKSVAAQVYNNAGVIYMNSGQYDNAYNAFSFAVKNVGGNPISPICHFNLAYIEYMMADSGFKSHSEVFSKKLYSDVLANFIFLSEDQRLTYWNNVGALLNGYNKFLSLEEDESIYTGTIYDNSLFSRGLLLRMSNYVTDEITRSMTTDSQDKLSQIAEYKNLIASGNVSPDSASYYQGLVIRLEKELMRDNLKYDALSKTFLTSWKDVKKHLRKGEAAIEFIRLPIIDGNNFSGENEYAALILTSRSKYPELVRLCHEDSITTLLETPDGLMRINNETARNKHYRAYLYGNGTYRYRIGKSKPIYIETVGQSLYNLLWSGIDDKLNGIERIYYSPTGALSSISFGALTSDSISLGDRYDLRLVSSTYEVVLPHEDNDRITNSVLYGGIQYDADETALVTESRSYQRDNLMASRGLDMTSADRSAMEYLKATLPESQMIQHKLDSVGISARLITGIQANEESFKSLSGHSPQLLHIATHGFFLSSPKEIQSSEFLANVSGNFPQNQQTMLRSGLLFAGANRVLTGLDIIDGIEDGVLTAEEISRLNLGNTNIAVLSACETGLGVDAASEGVFGLQRAFKLAGVKTLVMSLWKVPDEATSNLMQLFYDNWLSGMDKHEAFKKAQLQIKQQYPNPYYWAGFVMLD